MTRVLHTADVHLSPDAPEREAALRTLLERAEEDDVEVVTVGGDLFDQPEDVDELRTDLRNDLFADRPFEILLIPGNHDVEAYRGDVFFGDACTVITEEPFGQWTAPADDLRITGLPYRERPDDELLLALQGRDPFEGPEALLFHCSLDAPFDDQGTGEEGARRYFPVTEELLSELGFDYYLAGHYHSSHKVAFSDGAEFTYPGSPASTRSSETGRRRVSVLDPTEGIDFETIDTYHYVSRHETVTPGEGADLIEDIRTWSDQYAIDTAEASVRVDGYVEMGEDEFYAQLSEAADPASVTDETRSVGHLRSHALFEMFQEELEELDWDDETSKQVTDRTLEVYSRLSARGEI